MGGRLPRLPRTVLFRRRLEAALDTWAPLTLIRGMAGYGKTALVTSWLEQQDADLVHPIVLTAQPELTAVSFDRELFVEVHQNRQNPPEKFPQRDSGSPGLGQLDLEVTQLSADQRMLLVIEDGHYLTDPGWLRGLVALLRRHRRLHVIVCAWGSHPLVELAAGRVEHQEITPSELLLTETEIREFDELQGNHREDQEYSRLRAAFGGWFAPTMLALTAPTPGDGTRRAQGFIDLNLVPAIDEFGSRELASWLASASHLDDTLVRDINASIPGDMLALERSGVLQHAGNHAGYQFAPGVRDALRHRFEADDPAKYLNCQRWLGKWYGRRASINDDSAEALVAFRHAMLGKDWDGAHDVWVQFESRFSMHQPQDYLDLLNEIPEQVLTARPAWSVARRAMASVATNLDRGWEVGVAVIMAHLQAAEEARWVPAELPLHDLLYLGAYRVASRRFQGYHAADEYGDRLHKEVTRRLRRGEFAGDRLGFFLVQRWVDKTMLGDELAAMRFAIDASRLPLHSTSPHHNAQAGASIAHTFALRGDRKRAVAGLAFYNKWATPGTWGHRMIASPARFAEGLMALDDLDEAAARRAVNRLAEGRGVEPIWPFISYLNAQFELHFGDRQAALDRVNHAGIVGDGHFTTHEMAAIFDDTANPILQIARAEALISLGRAQQARHLLRGADTSHPAVGTALALAELALGQYNAARIAIAHVARRPTNPRQRLHFLLIDASAALHLNDHSTARGRIRQINSLYSSVKILRAFTRVPSPHVDSIADQVLSRDERALVRNARAVFPHSQGNLTLTPRERTLIQSLQQGLSRQQTAQELFLTMNTVKSQYSDLYRKLGVNSREQVLLLVTELGLLD